MFTRFERKYQLNRDLCVHYCLEIASCWYLIMWCFVQWSPRLWHTETASRRGNSSKISIRSKGRFQFRSRNGRIFGYSRKAATFRQCSARLCSASLVRLYANRYSPVRRSILLVGLIFFVLSRLHKNCHSLAVLRYQ